MVLSGVTCAVDHHNAFPAGLDHAIDIQVEVAQRLGLRVVLTRGSMSLSQDDGGLSRREVVQSHDAIMAETHDETDFCLASCGRRPLDHLENLGWTGPQTWLAHGIHFDDCAPGITRWRGICLPDR